MVCWFRVDIHPRRRDGRGNGDVLAGARHYRILVAAVNIDVCSVGAATVQCLSAKHDDARLGRRLVCTIRWLFAGHRGLSDQESLSVVPYSLAVRLFPLALYGRVARRAVCVTTLSLYS